MNTQIDVRRILPAIRTPTLVMHRMGDRQVHFEEARYLAKHIPGAHLLELPGEDHLIYAGDQDQIISGTRDFVTGV